MFISGGTVAPLTNTQLLDGLGIFLKGKYNTKQLIIYFYNPVLSSNLLYNLITYSDLKL